MTLLDELRRLTAMETEAQAAARQRAEHEVRIPPPEIGALLEWTARATNARAVVEIGSAAGVTALWALRGMERGLVTSVEPDPGMHALAAKAHADAGLEDRVRSILGDPLEVLPRLSDASYDVVVVQVTGRLLDLALEHARRLVRPGGTILARSLLADQDVPVAVTSLLDEDGVTGALLPLDDGILLATVTSTDAE
ncbi:MAG: class I SAM-dependent methyltransferase [Nitriliruptorales bacterium]|nr:class I SAM-dependent methyltransferase [Nitriliruptorales bacterium]